MRPHSVTLPVTAPRTAEMPRPAGLDYPKKDDSRFRVQDNDEEDASSSAAVDAQGEAPVSPGEWSFGWSFAADQTGTVPLWSRRQAA